MDILIIEDEQPAAKRLQKLILKQIPDARIVGILESVKSAVRWFNEHPFPTLIFLDIQLADNLSFEIFKQVEVDVPVIFTTAYDQYTLQAFKLNSIDYLLKPIDEDELAQALDKYQRIFEPNSNIDIQTIDRIMQSIVRPQYKERFIVKAGQQMTYIAVKEIRYFYSSDGLAYAKMENNKRHIIDYTLDRLEPLVSPSHFFRINRKVICHVDAIRKINPYFNSRLALTLVPKPDFEVIVSRDRVSDFKKWLDQ
jgi:DNA-binding LytR/AlgR family response regulator